MQRSIHSTIEPLISLDEGARRTVLPGLAWRRPVGRRG